MEQENIKIKFDTNADEAAKDVNKLGKSLDEVQEASKGTQSATEKTGEALENLGVPIQSTISGFKAMLVQMWAMVANPIGAVLAAIVGVVALLGKAFMSTESNQNKFGKGVAVISGLFKGLLKVLEPVASFLVDNIVKSFEMAGQAILATSALLQRGLKAIGLSGAAQGLKGLTDAVENNIKSSGKLADAEAKLQKAQRESQRIQLDYQRQAEKIRQQRDDETKSIPERIALNEKLGALLKKQASEELNIAKQALNVANMRIKKEGESSANLDERAEALTNIADIQERISGQESEQLANLNSLRNEQKAFNKEQADARKAISDAEKQRQKELADERISAEKDLLQELQDLNDKTEEQQLARQKERAFAEIEILRQKGIDVESITRLNEEKFATLEQELFEKRLEEQKEKDQILFDQESEAKRKVAEEEIRIEEELATAKATIQQKTFDVISQGLSALGGIFQKNKALQKGVLIAESLAGIARTIINTKAANAAAALKYALLPGGVALAKAEATLNNVSAGIGIAANIAATSKALSALGGGGGGGGANLGNESGGSGSAQPTTAFNNSAQNQIGQTVANSQPIQVNVLESDISKAQSNVKVLENKNSF